MTVLVRKDGSIAGGLVRIRPAGREAAIRKDDYDSG